ncbi:MAG: papain-like cysteine peptidase [Acetobacteraceae bacterium]|nr:papain-like cysteine peptidase [Acetobacteraceae bacterium]
MSEANEGVVGLRQALEAVIHAGHRAILGREVEQGWVAVFLQELTTRCQSQSLEEVTAFFLQLLYNSPEGAARAASLTRDQVLERILPSTFGGRPVIPPCISAGPTPLSASLLRRAGLRRWAGPLDWMTMPPAAVLDCIADDFHLLLNPAEHESVPPRERPEGSLGHLALHKRLTARHGPTHFHRWDPTTPEGYAALERAVLRMREALRGLHGKMLLQVAAEDDDTLRVFAEMTELLDRVGRGVTFVHVAILEDGLAAPFPEMELHELRGTHRLLRCRPVSAMGTLGFADLLDEVVILRGALAAPGLDQPTI